MDTHHAEIGREIRSTGKLEAETEEKLKAAIEEFKKIRNS
jgi:F-type H+-transporting ATPase subunit alpha